ncbi:type II inositol 1,4,5-trisphosphate 5-phosphatase-like [Heliangelus exortis]|uniref:type II inositol 1,4,5-trisphosphate 5-phosphatase-like n=1 Tax=Heliangelus exortis TaxID=472823 RepID=UPI003A916620
MLLLYVREDPVMNISEVEAETVGTGIMGKMGNKGGVAIRFKFHNTTTLCILNSHLAADIEEYKRRNQDFQDICSRMQFRQSDPNLASLTIAKHDVILWLGDLNYRLEDLDVAKVKQLVEEKAFPELWQYDHVAWDESRRGIFEGFTEGELSFQPTYKYDARSDSSETHEKCRVPAWCDRILWKGQNIAQLSYRSHMALKISDHKPVSSVFDIGVKVVDEELYRKAFEEVVRSQDKMENASIPSVTLSQREFYFAEVKYMQLQVGRFTICNGEVACQFEFINKPDEKAYSKKWLAANPSKGFLLPGSNAGSECRLIDFIPFVTKYGFNHLPAGAEKTPLMPLEISDDAIEAEKPVDIPKELWMMVDHLYRDASQQVLGCQDIAKTWSDLGCLRSCLKCGSHSVRLLALRALVELFLKYQTILAESDDITIQVTNIVNPASFLEGRTLAEPIEHDCLETIEAVYSSRPDLKEEPFEDADNWFSDGSSFVKQGVRMAGYAVTTTEEVIESNPLPAGTSTQRAELIALIRALELAENMRINIWTDSKYAFSVVHAHGAIWKERGLLTTQGKAVKHAEEIL